MTSERETFERLLDLLDRTLGSMGSMHGKPKDFETGVPLHRAEIHTIDAIGSIRALNVSKLAEKMTITKGAASQMITRLVKKGMVRRVHPEDDARETLLELTDLGWTGYRSHRAFHMSMFDVARKVIDKDFKTRLERLVAAFEDLNLVLQALSKRGGRE